MNESSRAKNFVSHPPRVLHTWLVTLLDASFRPTAFEVAPLSSVLDCVRLHTITGSSIAVEASLSCIPYVAWCFGLTLDDSRTFEDQRMKYTLFYPLRPNLVSVEEGRH